MLNATQNLEYLDSLSRENDIHKILKQKPSLRKFYEDAYARFAKCLLTCPVDGVAIELGSGAGFIKAVIPEITTTDILPYEAVDLQIDATNLPFEPGEVRFVCMLNVLHHIPAAENFFSEAVRCLKPGGKICIIDQHRGWFSTPILKYVHHEPYDDCAKDWNFDSSGPLSSANGALAYLIFTRDRELFEERYPQLTITNYQPFCPLAYWLAGGLKSWSLLPSILYPFARAIDRSLVKIHPKFGSFVEIELERK